MKKLLLFIAIISFVVTTCKKDNITDYANPENLAGTTWKCSDDPNPDLLLGYEYTSLEFASISTVQAWSKYEGFDEESLGLYNYSIVYKTITLSQNQSVQGFGPVTGTIDREEIILQDGTNNQVYLKQ